MPVQTHNKWATTALVVILWVPTLSAQTSFARFHAADRTGAGVSYESLPNAPLPADLSEKDAADQAIDKRMAPKYADTIEPGYESVRLSSIGKVRLAGGELFSIEFPVEVVFAAGLSHGLDTDPKYGTNSEAFAKRVGAAGARDASQIILSDAILAPLLKQDPRYYVKGPGHSFINRAAYAATRVLISRTDSGRSTVNFADLAGYGGSAALTQFYYPERSRGRNIMFSAFGTSLLGLVINNEASEFLRFLNPRQPR